MIFIYDFDGTLTPYSLPQYPILKKFVDDYAMMRRIHAIMDSRRLDFYNAYYVTFRDILEENGVKMTIANVCDGAENVTFNKGVLDFFERQKRIHPNSKHYIVTSGIKYFVDKTPIARFVDDVYGVTFYPENGKLGEISFLLTDERKVDVIKEIQRLNDNSTDIVYFGDGLTDRSAFEHVKRNGGKAVFVIANEDGKAKFQELEASEILTHCFEADFTQGSPIDSFVEGLNALCGSNIAQEIEF